MDIKFSDFDPNLLALLSNRDIQLFTFGAQNQIAGVAGFQKDNLGMHVASESVYQQRSSLKLVKNIEVGQVNTFEWQRKNSVVDYNNQLDAGADFSGAQLILAAHTNGKISLINTNLSPQGIQGPMVSTESSAWDWDNRVTLPAKTEKVFVTAGMVQNARHCHTLAWNRVNPRIFAAGYDNSGSGESSLLIWDIERDMNRHLKNVRNQEQQFHPLKQPRDQYQLPTTNYAPNSHPFGPSTPQNYRNLGQVETNLGPKIVTECLFSFPNIVEDIYSVEWLPDSDNELICATEDQILLCDTRQNFKKENIFQLSHENKSQFSSIKHIKFDPFWSYHNKNHRRFAAYTDDEIFIFDLRTNQVLYQIKSDSLSELEEQLLLSQKQQKSHHHGARTEEKEGTPGAQILEPEQIGDGIDLGSEQKDSGEKLSKEQLQQKYKANVKTRLANFRDRKQVQSGSSLVGAQSHKTVESNQDVNEGLFHNKNQHEGHIFIPYEGSDDYQNKVASNHMYNGKMEFKKFSGFSWCHSRKNLLVTYQNYKDQSKIKFWDLKAELIIDEQADVVEGSHPSKGSQKPFKKQSYLSQQFNGLLQGQNHVQKQAEYSNNAQNIQSP